MAICKYVFTGLNTSIIQSLLCKEFTVCWKIERYFYVEVFWFHVLTHLSYAIALQTMSYY